MCKLATNEIKKKYEKRNCPWCEENIPHAPNVAKTHNLDTCRNKPSEVYFDSCASSHITNKHPSKPNKLVASIITGTGSKAPITGTGTFKVGKIVLENTKCAPKMRYNLISAKKITDDGITAMIKQSKPNLELKHDGKIVATGNFDENGLLKMDDPIEPGVETKNPKKIAQVQQEKNQYSYLSLEEHCTSESQIKNVYSACNPKIEKETFPEKVMTRRKQQKMKQKY